MLAKAGTRFVSNGKIVLSIKQAYTNETAFWIGSPESRLRIDSGLKVLYGL